jgi:hypothetical protein
MNEITPILQQVAPTLAMALKGPFAAVAYRYIQDNLPAGSEVSGTSPQEVLRTLLADAKNLQLIKSLDQPFRLEMQKLDVDLQTLENSTGGTQPKVLTRDTLGIRPQVIISALFLSAYFLMMAGIFYVEISDDLNMKTGNNSLMDQLQILFGVLTAGVVQILSYWFGGALGKKTP